MTTQETITTQLIGYDASANNEPIYLTIYWNDKRWMIHADNDQWMGYAEGVGTDTEASDFIQFNLLNSGWFKQAENLDD